MILKQAVFIFLMILFSIELICQQVLINEFMSSNQTTIADEDGDYPDWIELYNPGAFPVNLKNYTISDDKSNPARWVFPDITIQAYGHLLIFASGKDRKSGEYLHTNFSIKSEGEPLILANPDGVWVDWVDEVALLTDISYGRKYDGSNEWVYFETPSPGSPNENGQTGPGPGDTLEFSILSGFLTTDTNLYIAAPEGNMEIRYTLDGSEPGLDTELYTEYIKLTPEQTKTNTLSFVKTAPNWEAPQEDIPSGIFLKAAGFKDGQKVTHTTTAVYFFKKQFKRIDGWPVFSLVIDSLDFFGDEYGIYVPGYAGNSLGVFYSNFYRSGRDWERDVHVSFFDEQQKLIFQQNAGARIHGSGTRKAPQKTLRLYARGQYGENYFNYPFFSEKPNISQYKRLLLRTTMGDWNRVGFSDEFAAFIVRPMNQDHMEFKPVLVFINGEFWGIQHLRERVDKYFFMFNHGVHPEKIDYLDDFYEVNEGSPDDYIRFTDKLFSLDPTTDAFYQYAESNIDLENLTDYYIAKLYLNNIDWPFRNFSYWKPENGKWRWVFYDCDACFIRFGDRNFVDYIQDKHLFPEKLDTQYHELIRRMLKNKRFRDDFIRRFSYHLTHHFTPERLIPALEKMAEKHRTFLDLHVKRWHYPDQAVQFESNLNDLRQFVIRRYHLFQQLLPAYFGDAFVVYPNPLNKESQYLHISWNFFEPGLNETFSYQISDMQGRIVGKGKTQTGEVITIDHSLSAGIYIIEVNTSGMSLRNKFVVE